MVFNWWTFLFETVNFVVLAYVLHRLLYRPLREAIEKRREANSRAQEAAEKARQEAALLQQRLQAELVGAEEKRQELIHQAHEQAESERRKLLEETDRAAQQRQEEVQQAIALQREEALHALHDVVIAQAIELTGRLLGEASERTLDQQLALRLVETLEQLPNCETTHLQTSQPSSNGAVLESARPLDAGTLERLTRVVCKIVGRPISLAVTSRPELLGGVRLRVGGQVWDGSLAGQLTSADSVVPKENLRP